MPPSSLTPPTHPRGSRPASHPGLPASAGPGGGGSSSRSASRFLALLVASTAIVPFAEPEPITTLPPSTYAPIAVTGVTTPITVDREPDSAIVVEFSVPMDATSALAAFTASVGGRVLGGSRTLTDDGTLLTFRPAGPLPAGATVDVLVDAGAASVDGVDLGADAMFGFRVLGSTVTTGDSALHRRPAATRRRPAQRQRTPPRRRTTRR